MKDPEPGSDDRADATSERDDAGTGTDGRRHVGGDAAARDGRAGRARDVAPAGERGTVSVLRLLNPLAWLVVGLLLPTLFSPVPRFLEDVYTPFVFRPIATMLSILGGLAPFSLAQLVVGLALSGAVVLLAHQARRLRQEGRRAILPVFRTWATILAITVWSFHLVWGLHYARLPFRERTGLPAVEATPERLARLTRMLARETNHAHRMARDLGEITVAPDSTAELLVERERLLEALALGYPKVLPDTGDWSTSPPKFPEPAGWLLTRLGISGIYFPFTGEAAVNGRMPTIAVPFVAAHEMAHQKGIAREDEANALAYLACRSAGLWVTRYSGALAAYRRAWGALARADADSARALAPARVLSPGPEADRRAIQDFWQRHEGTLSQAAERTNDTYLKANAQRAGIESYGRMIDILLALDEAGSIGD